MNKNGKLGSLNVVMLGGTGAVGGGVLHNLLHLEGVSKITSLGRNTVESIQSNDLQ